MKRIWTAATFLGVLGAAAVGTETKLEHRRETAEADLKTGKLMVQYVAAQSDRGRLIHQSRTLVKKAAFLDRRRQLCAQKYEEALSRVRHLEAMMPPELLAQVGRYKSD